jgi:predicted dehydrogenase
MGEQDRKGAVKNTSPLRLGIIGCGAIAEGAHLPAALSSSMVELTSLSDNSESRLRYIQDKFGLGRIGVLDYKEMFSLVDAVVLALPNSLHASVGREFLSRGIHVLCEKPLATSHRECQELCKTAREASAVLAVGFVTRFFPSTELTKQLIESDFLGALKSFDYEFGTAGGWAPLSGYNLSSLTSGGGVLVISGSHFVDRMFYLFGDLELLEYTDDNHGGVEANCVARVQGNVRGRHLQGQITLSKTHLLSNRLRIDGERGTLEIREGQSLTVAFLSNETGLRHDISCRERTGSEPEPDYFKVQLEDFIQAIHTGGRPRIDGEQGSKSVATTERCYKTASSLEETWCTATLQRLKSALPGYPAETIGLCAAERVQT